MQNFEAEVQSVASSRRSFLATAGGAALSFMIVPRHVLGGAGFIAPSERLNIAGIGAGGMGGGDIATVARLGPTSCFVTLTTNEQPAHFKPFPMPGR